MSHHAYIMSCHMLCHTMLYHISHATYHGICNLIYDSMSGFFMFYVISMWWQVMAYIMPYHAIYHVMLYHVSLYISYHVTYGMSYYISDSGMLYHVMSHTKCVMSYVMSTFQVISCHVPLCHPMSCHRSCHVMLYSMSCHIMLYIMLYAMPHHVICYENKNMKTLKNVYASTCQTLSIIPQL